MALKIKSIKKVLSKARTCKVRPVKLYDTIYRVTSPSDEVYYSDVQQLTCTCPRQEWITGANGWVNLCSHVQAALIFHYLTKGYWLVGRSEDADVSNLKRKEIAAVLPGWDEGDGVKFTARKIPEARAHRHLANMVNDGKPEPDAAEMRRELEYAFGTAF